MRFATIAYLKELGFIYKHKAEKNIKQKGGRNK
jgi:hypothetical protein